MMEKGQCKARPCTPMLSEDYCSKRKVEIKSGLPGDCQGGMDFGMRE